jgi:hypothetical protein
LGPNNNSRPESPTPRTRKTPSPSPPSPSPLPPPPSSFSLSQLSVGSKQQLETREPYTEDKEDTLSSSSPLPSTSPLPPLSLFSLPPPSPLPSHLLSVDGCSLLAPNNNSRPGSLTPRTRRI